jgi:hypothetical protein
MTQKYYEIIKTLWDQLNRTERDPQTGIASNSLRVPTGVPGEMAAISWVIMPVKEQPRKEGKE